MLTNNGWADDKQVENGMLLCQIERVDSVGIPWVRLPDGRTVHAKTTTAVTSGELLEAAAAGAQAVVALLSDTHDPVIVGIIATHAIAAATTAATDPLSAEIDGESVILTGKNEIVLRCGKASITLTKAGKILLRGEYLSSRSSGVNRIKGGSVQIN